MAERICSVPDCGKPRHERYFLCTFHFGRKRRYGDPLASPPPRARQDLTGRRFGTLVVIRRDDGYWWCLCDCGMGKRVRTGGLNAGNVKSCGLPGRHYYKSQADVSYAGAHERVRLRHGRPNRHDCVDCGAVAHAWSYNHADPDERTEVVNGYLVSFSASPEFYEPRCRSCHVKLDRYGKHRWPVRSIQ